jgi:hypothetical protein
VIKGSHHSDISKNRISLSNKGHSVKEETRKLLRILTLKANLRTWKLPYIKEKRSEGISLAKLGKSREEIYGRIKELALEGFSATNMMASSGTKINRGMRRGIWY